MTAARRRLGRAAEELVASRLRAEGWTIRERNARTRHGEIDIVALDRSDLVFVEVKAGREGAIAGPERPVLAIGPRKQRRLRGLAAAWLAQDRERPGGAAPRQGWRHLGGAAPRPGQWLYANIRFDAVGVTFSADGSVADYEHIRGAW